MKLRIKKGDTVQVISGSSKGKAGKVKSVHPEKLRVVIEGVNIRKRSTKPTQTNPKGGILEKEMPIHYSNVLILDSKGKPTRMGIKKGKDGRSIRIAKTSGEELSK